MPDSSPLDETPAETAHPSRFPKHWVILGLLFLVHALIGAYCTPADQTLSNLTAGVMISQPILLATWAAFARQRFYHRLLWSLLICTYLSFADDLGAVQQPMPFRPCEIILENLAIYVVVLGILHPVRRFSKWQITQPDAKDAPSVYLENHFGINHLLILTAIVALACGLVRSLFIISAGEPPYSSVVDFIGSLSQSLVLAFPSCVVPWILLAHRRTVYGLMLMTILVACVLDFLACYVMLQMIPKWLFFESVVVPGFGMQLGAILSAVGSTLVLRYCGFRMIREMGGQSPTQKAPSAVRWPR